MDWADGDWKKAWHTRVQPNTQEDQLRGNTLHDGGVTWTSKYVVNFSNKLRQTNESKKCALRKLQAHLS